MGMAGREEGEAEMYGESNMETYNTICRIDSNWELAIWLRELKQGLCDNLEGWGGEGDGKEGNMNVPMADTCWCLTENKQTKNSVKQLSFNLKINLFKNAS